MSTRKEKALKLFNEKYNCAQSILLAYNDIVGLDNETAYKIAQGFGGGYGRMGKTCGTLNAAVMVLSLKYSNTTKGDMDNIMETRKIVRSFINDFTANHNGINCTDILREEPGKTYIMHSEKCAKTVSEICDLLDKYLSLD